MTLIPRHSAIALSALQEKGYRENKAARRRFERPYGYLAILSVVLFFGSIAAIFAFAPRSTNSGWVAVGAGVGFIGLTVAFLSAWRMLHVVPVNPQTHHPLDIYERADTRTKDGFLEWIYVDHDTKTYFVRPARLAYGRGGS